MRVWVVLSVVVALVLPVSAWPQSREETLADIRQELTVMYVEIQKLKRELSTTGGVSTGGSGGTVLDRVNAIEAELQSVTARTEELELRINRIVQDGTNRIGDLEFRLVELEGGDVSQLGETSTLGGDLPGGSGTATITPDPETETGVELAVGEQADFDRAVAALEAGNSDEAAQLFADFGTAYPGGPLSGRAAVLRGEALEASGDLTGAARAYLDAFSAAPQGTEAPDALFRLGQALGQLGQTEEACLTLGEVEARFPGSEPVLEAQSAMRTLGCS